MFTVTRETFDNLNRQLSATSASTANAITKAFETFKWQLEIAHEEESEQESAGTQDHESLGEPPAKQRWNNNLQSLMRKIKIGKSPEFEALNIDSEILNSLKQDLLKEETSPEVDRELASIINSMPKDGLSEEKLQEKISKHQEWMLSTHLFQEIVVTWGTPIIDVFTSRLNKQIAFYASWKPDPEATYEGCIFDQLEWSFLLYAFPPFSLIAQCFPGNRDGKIRGHIYTQPWYSQLLRKLKDVPRTLPQRSNTLQIP